MKIGILTGGGDTASLNAIIYGAAEAVEQYGNEIIGFGKGWKGTLGFVDIIEFDTKIVDPSRGGTFLKSSRTNPDDEMLNEAVANIEGRVDGLIVIGGDDTLTVGKKIVERSKIPVCCVTKTIDNDVGVNAPDGKMDYSLIVNYLTSGFATAAYKAASFANDLRTTAYSHERVMFLETMGRGPGWLALSSYKGEPDFILVPEIGLDFERFKEKLAERYNKTKHVVVVVAEGVRYEGNDTPISQDDSNVGVFGHKKLGGVAEILAERVKNELGIHNSNYVNPSYLYRCGSPTQLEEQQEKMIGHIAATTLFKRETGQVAVLQRHGDDIVAETKPIDEVLLTDAKGKVIPRTLDMRFYDTMRYNITDRGREYFRVIK